MGYYTNYKLSILNKDKPDYDKLNTFIEQNKDNESEELPNGKVLSYPLNYLLELFDEGSEPTKWYDHEDDMKEFSRMFPNLVFELSGEGEESGDIWKKYFRDGKMQKCEAKIIFDSFDETKLK